MCFLNKAFGKMLSPLAKLSPVGGLGIASNLLGKKKNKDKEPRVPMQLPSGAQSLLQDQMMGRGYMRDIF